MWVKSKWPVTDLAHVAGRLFYAGSVIAIVTQLIITDLDYKLRKTQLYIIIQLASYKIHENKCIIIQFPTKSMIQLIVHLEFLLCSAVIAQECMNILYKIWNK